MTNKIIHKEFKEWLSFTLSNAPTPEAAEDLKNFAELIEIGWVARNPEVKEKDDSIHTLINWSDKIEKRLEEKRVEVELRDSRIERMNDYLINKGLVSDFLKFSKEKN